MADLKNIIEPDTLFIGDSYFEFWHYENYAKKTFKEIFDCSKYLNIGVGGTKYSDWNELLEEIKYFPKFKNIVVNLGFNDLHYCKKNTPKHVYNAMLTFIDKINNIFDKPNILILNVCHAPGCDDSYNKEIIFNKMLSKNAKKIGVEIVDNSSSIYQRNLLENVFDIDKVHLNGIGYEIMFAEIKKNLK